ncbi:MAG: hypothetical protein BMS9Abin17_0636 [Acidimicrobiia bacterium]|nr:MAG: hypothetical protein BMS9Abin17_0636 [Acidimicrobiia bacterium]
MSIWGRVGYLSERDREGAFIERSVVCGVSFLSDPLLLAKGSLSRLRDEANVHPLDRGHQ